MGVNINTFKQFVEAVQNKSTIGNTVTIAQFNLFAKQAQLAKFESDRKAFLATNEISNYLAWFMKTATIQVPPSGEITKPADWQHTISVRRYFVRPNGKSIEVEVKESKDKSWGEIQASSLLEPTLRFPKFQNLSHDMRFLPRNIGTIILSYLGTPVAPNWDYTVVNSRPVYNPATSVDFTFPEAYLNVIASEYLTLVGVNMKEGELVAFAQQFKQENNTVL